LTPAAVRSAGLNDYQKASICGAIGLLAADAPRDVGSDRYGGVVTLPALDLDLEIFSGPFDLLLALVLREEVDLLDLELADVVLAYLDHLEGRGELDLETATEFIVLIAALLELKSRLMLAEDGEELLDIEPGEAAEELLERMLQARRYRSASTHLRELFEKEQGVRFRSAPLPAHLRKAIAPSEGSQDPAVLGQSIGRLLRMPPTIDLRHISTQRVTVAERLDCLRVLLRRGRFSFEEAVRGEDRMTVAVTVFALLELYKRGEAWWEQEESFGEIAVHAATNAAQSPLARAGGLAG
jgi:segregation and condensation protein A